MRAVARHLQSRLRPRRPTARSITMCSITPSFGSEVHGIDLARVVSDPAALADLHELVYHRGLVVIRNQEHLSPHDELAFARAFNHQPDPPGETSYTGGAAPQAKLPHPLHDVAVIGTFDLHDYYGFSGTSAGVYPPWSKGQLAWHTDGFADTEPPPDLTTMRCVATPETGGETIFRCARLAANRLGPAIDVGGAVGLVDPELVRIQYKLPKEARLRASGFSLAWSSGGEPSGIQSQIPDSECQPGEGWHSRHPGSLNPAFRPRG